MSSENPVADRLLDDARKRETQAKSSPLDITALVLGLVAIASSGLIPILGIVAGLAAIVVGIVATKKPGNTKMAWGGAAAGAIGIIVGVLYTLSNIGVI
ncbi:MAG TPA: hypothetical protein VFE65_10185 [Pseudonocardia sp.]|jgi:hypothetical protein|nr:hypothetical protein [Pseudonocardia sp.]